jgi:L-malate glycosyltransferase
LKSILYIGNKLSHHGFTPGVIETLGKQLEEAGLKVFYAGTRKNRFFRLLEILFKTITIGRRVDYILIDTYSSAAFWFAFFAGVLAKVVGTEYITILHGGDLPARLSKSVYASSILFGRSLENVAVSGYLEYEFKRAGFKTRLIPNNIDISLYNFKERKKFTPSLLWVRSFHSLYNPLMAVDTISILKEYYPDVRLAMVGPDKDGSLESFCLYAAKKGVAGNILITGRLSKSDWIKLSEEYDFFLNTTDFDNTPVSVIEAMALGMCIVSTNPGGIPYLLTDSFNASLVNKGDANAMAEKILQLINLPLKAREMALEARKTAEKFDWERVKPLWMTLLS